MPCYRPLHGYRSSTGKGISFNPKTGYMDRPMTVPCGQCIGCRLERSRQWAVRCMHEASLHDDSCFLTLTYDDWHLPDGGTLVKKDFQDFMKRLRKHVKKRISFFHCGEYGDDLDRPHYHALIFGYDFPDKAHHKKTANGVLYTSPTLESLWNKGFSTIGPVTFETAAYTARYVLKKVTGENADQHYKGKLPEYITMSNRPAIGLQWFEQYASDVYPSDTVISRGHPAKPPRYYDKRLDKSNEALHKEIKRDRELLALDPTRLQNNTPSRLNVRETVTKARLNLYSRNLSNEK